MNRLLAEKALIRVKRRNNVIIINKNCIFFDNRIFVLDNSINAEIRILSVIKEDDIGSNRLNVEVEIGVWYRENKEKNDMIDKFMHTAHHILDFFVIKDIAINKSIIKLNFNIYLRRKMIVYQSR